MSEAAVAEWTAETTAFERVHAIARGLHEPASAAEVADRARVSPTTARSHLRTLADTGTVAVEEGSPTTYRRSRASRVTERATELLADHSRSELAARIAENEQRLREWRTEYDADSPEAFARAYDVDGPDSRLGRVLTEWETTRRNLRFAEAALAIGEVTDTGTERPGESDDRTFGERIEP